MSLAVVYGALTLASVAVALLARRVPDLLGVALLIASTWAVGMVAIWAWGVPTALLTYPPTDFVAGLILAHLWAKRPATWKLVTLSAFLLQIIAHFVFWLNDDWRAIYHRYMLLLNVLFLVQLGTVAGPGLWDVMGWGDVVGWMRDRLGSRRPAYTRTWPRR